MIYNLFISNLNEICFSILLSAKDKISWYFQNITANFKISFINYNVGLRKFLIGAKKWIVPMPLTERFYHDITAVMFLFY